MSLGLAVGSWVIYTRTQLMSFERDEAKKNVLALVPNTGCSLNPRNTRRSQPQAARSELSLGSVHLLSTNRSLPGDRLLELPDDTRLADSVIVVLQTTQLPLL